jgi:hypothetical protein
MPMPSCSAVFGDHTPVERDLARIGRLRSGQDLHQRRFSGAVLADERVHFAGFDIERDAVERTDAGERLHDPRHAQERGGRRQRGYLLASAFV